jgi:TonB family protein
MRNLRLYLGFLALIAIPNHGFGQPAPSTQDGPIDVKPVPPKPDPSGVYEVGPGVASPVLLNPAPVTDLQDALASCAPHFLRIVAVVEANGAIRIRTTNPHLGDTCDALALSALQEFQFQPGMLNDKPVPVAVCILLNVGSIRPPVPRLVPCSAPGALGSRPPIADDTLRPPPGTKPPVLINNVAADFSNDARKNRIQGVVIVSLVVDEEGLPTDIQLVRGVGHGLDENAIAAVSKYRFHPATLDGKAIAYSMTVEVSFHLMN